LEKAFTWLAMDKQHCDDARNCLNEASTLEKYADGKVRDKLERYTILLNQSCG
jgi:hypothetical protein